MAITAAHDQHVTIVGAVYIDTILTTPHYPEEDLKLRATSLQVRRGGNGANSSEILTQYGHDYERTLASPVLVSALPASDSADYRFIQASLPGVRLEAAGVQANAESSEAPKSWIIRSEATSSRTIINHNALQELAYDDLARLYTSSDDKEDMARTTCWWHFEGRNVEAIVPFIRLIRDTQADAVVISLEIEKPGRAGLQDVAHLCDFVFYSKSFAMHAGFASMGEFLMAERQRLVTQQAQTAASTTMLYTEMVFCTWGEAGSGAVKMDYDDDAGGVEVYACDAVLPRQGKVVDTVGAGDVFVGSMIAQLAAIQGSEDVTKVLYPRQFVEACLREANTLCGIKICQEGFTNVRKQSLDAAVQP